MLPMKSLTWVFHLEYIKLSILNWYVVHWVKYHIFEVEYLIFEMSI